MTDALDPMAGFADLAEAGHYAGTHHAPEPRGNGPRPVPNLPDDAPVRPVRDGVNDPVDQMRARLLDTEAVRHLEPPEALIDGYLRLDSLAVAYGASGCGKSFLAVDLALHVATGSWWHGHEVKAAAPVVYVAAEGVSGLGRRVDAWCAHNGVYQLDRHQPVWWYPQAVNVADIAETYAFAELCAGLGARLVVFDTLARCILGAEENSAKDMGAVVANLDRIRRATGACVLAVHHTGKDGAAGARGSSALRAAVDTELEVAASDQRITLRVAKQKDGAEAHPLRLDRIPVGDSCALVPSTSVVRASEGLAPGALQTLEALREVMVPEGVSTTVWERAASHCGHGTFYRHRHQLLEHRQVRNVGTDARPRYVIADTEVNDT